MRSDPFIRLRIGEHRFDSDCVKASLNPSWGPPPEGVHVNSDGRSKNVIQIDTPVFAEVIEHQRIEIILWDKDYYTKKSVSV